MSNQEEEESMDINQLCGLMNSALNTKENRSL